MNFLNIFTNNLIITQFLFKQILSMQFWKQFKNIILNVKMFLLT